MRTEKRPIVNNNLHRIANQANYKLTLKEKYWILMNCPVQAIAVVYAYENDTGYTKLKSDTKYIRFSENGKVNVLEGCHDWYTSDMTLDMLARLTSRHNLYIIDKIKGQLCMLARLLCEEGLIQLSEDVQLKVIRGESVSNIEAAELAENILKLFPNTSKIIEQLENEVDKLEDDILEWRDELIELIDEIDENKIDNPQYIIDKLDDIKSKMYIDK